MVASLLMLAVLACHDEPVGTERKVGSPFFHGDGIDVGGSHFRYATLSWAPTGNPGEVQFRLRAAFRRSAYVGARCVPTNCSGGDGHPVTGDVIIEEQGPTLLRFGDGTPLTDVLRFRVTAYSVTENWIVGEALNPGTSNIGIRHTYSSSGAFTAKLAASQSEDACCRIGQVGFETDGLNNRPGGSYPLQTVVVVPLTRNRSPVSSMVPIVVVPPSSNAQFLVPAADPDHDPISWRLATSDEAGTGSPLHPPGLTVDGSTGIITWNNIGLDQTNFWTTQIVIQDGATKTPVDFLLKIKSTIGSLPTCTISPAGPRSRLFGSPLTFTVTGSDADAGASVTLNSGGLPPGATVSPALPVTGASGVSVTFNWTPTADQVGSYAVIFSATDNDNQQGLCSTTIEVTGRTVKDIGSDGGTVTIQQDGKAVAGIDIPANTFQGNVTVTVQLVELATGQHCHDYLLFQQGRCLQITAVNGGGPAFLTKSVIVGLCVPPDLKIAEPGLDIFKFETRQDRVVALAPAHAGFLDCAGFTIGSVAPSNWLDRFAQRMGQWLAPKPLIAAVDLGFGGVVPPGALSFFTWADPIQVSFAGLAVNQRNSGKDGFSVSGTFYMGAKNFLPNSDEEGFVPSRDAVIVGFGKVVVSTIPAGSFRPVAGGFVYTAPLGTTTGVLAMQLYADGRFLVSGAVTTEGGGLPTFRSFSLQIGHRTQGAGLVCDATGKCTRHAA